MYVDHSLNQNFCISIAVVHHFASHERRIAAVKAVIDALTTDGRAMIYVWALEQATSRRGWQTGDDQDVMVPWETRDNDSKTVYKRYYHLFREGELEEMVRVAGGRIESSGYERDNWWTICQRK